MVRVIAALVVLLLVPAVAEAQLRIIDDEVDEAIPEPLELWLGIAGHAGVADFSASQPGAPGLDAETFGGASLTFHGDHDGWLRAFDLRLTILGAGHDTASDGGARLASTVLARAELGAGLFHRFGPVVPYLLARIALGARSSRFDSSEPDAEAAQADSAGDFHADLGVEVGAALALDAQLRVHAAYEATFFDVPSHAATFGFSARFL